MKKSNNIKIKGILGLLLIFLSLIFGKFSAYYLPEFNIIYKILIIIIGVVIGIIMSDQYLKNLFNEN